MTTGEVVTPADVIAEVAGTEPVRDKLPSTRVLDVWSDCDEVCEVVESRVREEDCAMLDIVVDAMLELDDALAGMIGASLDSSVVLDAAVVEDGGMYVGNIDEGKVIVVVGDDGGWYVGNIDAGNDIVVVGEGGGWYVGNMVAGKDIVVLALLGNALSKTDRAL